MEYLCKYVIEDNIFYYDDIIEGEKINKIYRINTKRGKNGILNL